MQGITSVATCAESIQSTIGIAVYIDLFTVSLLVDDVSKGTGNAGSIKPLYAVRRSTVSNARSIAKNETWEAG